MPEATEDEALLFPCVVCGEESEAMICDECWDDFKRVAGVMNGQDD